MRLPFPGCRYETCRKNCVAWWLPAIGGCRSSDSCWGCIRWRWRKRIGGPCQRCPPGWRIYLHASRPEVFAKGAPAWHGNPDAVPGMWRAASENGSAWARQEHVNQLRMAHAARELMLGSSPIIEVALDCGFNNLAHFYALFRKTHGMTPRRYRMGCQRQVI
ncbi:MAG: helix-turn-helix transcriptional regulator [Chryseolinea sp.]